MHRLIVLAFTLLFASPLVAADPARPNILFIIFDDWGWQHAGEIGRAHV